jgi:hypothetical protein
MTRDRESMNLSCSWDVGGAGTVSRPGGPGDLLVFAEGPRMAEIGTGHGPRLRQRLEHSTWQVVSNIQCPVTSPAAATHVSRAVMEGQKYGRISNDALHVNHLGVLFSGCMLLLDSTLERCPARFGRRISESDHLSQSLVEFCLILDQPNSG